jgi:hypothetical protein
VIEVSKRKWFISARHRYLRRLLSEWIASRRNPEVLPEMSDTTKKQADEGGFRNNAPQNSM